MSAPEKVRLKRKRTEDPPESLLLTRAQDVDSVSPQKRIRYVIEKNEQASNRRSRSPLKSVVSRLFHLRKSQLSHGELSEESGSHQVVPTVEETSRGAPRTVDTTRVPNGAASQSEPEQALRRPGRGSAIVSRQLQGVKARPVGSPKDVASLANSMHEFALQEVDRTAQSVSSGRPKMSAAQVKDRHERRMASARAVSTPRPADAMDLDDFVYDTYILSSTSATDTEMDGTVGLLIIDEHDEDYWHELLAQNEVEDQQLSDDDENAEDHYAADYPEDELASDDEFNRDAYRFRGAGSDDEQWDHRDDSDNDSDVYDGEVGFGNRVSMVRRWEDDLGMRGPSSYDYD